MPIEPMLEHQQALLRTLAPWLDTGTSTSVGLVTGNLIAAQAAAVRRRLKRVQEVKGWGARCMAAIASTLEQLLIYYCFLWKLRG